MGIGDLNSRTTGMTAGFLLKVLTRNGITIEVFVSVGLILLT
jgi:hypothetical protein